MDAEGARSFLQRMLKVADSGYICSQEELP
jgi:hypothetical protein